MSEVQEMSKVLRMKESQPIEFVSMIIQKMIIQLLLEIMTMLIPLTLVKNANRNWPSNANNWKLAIEEKTQKRKRSDEKRNAEDACNGRWKLSIGRNSRD